MKLKSAPCVTPISISTKINNVLPPVASDTSPTSKPKNVKNAIKDVNTALQPIVTIAKEATRCTLMENVMPVSPVTLIIACTAKITFV
ncbi:MAG: hypothetical protein QF704_06865 [Anaerolineales bacterium]|nr:hypothetical protein [Anaerolineales bacterium]